MFSLRVLQSKMKVAVKVSRSIKSGREVKARVPDGAKKRDGNAFFLTSYSSWTFSCSSLYIESPLDISFSVVT